MAQGVAGGVALGVAVGPDENAIDTPSKANTRYSVLCPAAPLDIVYIGPALVAVSSVPRVESMSYDRPVCESCRYASGLPFSPALESWPGGLRAA
jgi:hypothetical protein